MIDEKKLIECLNTKNEEYAVELIISPTMTIKQIVDATIQAFRKSMFKTIDAQPKVGEWIPCSERLPEDEKTKLVTLSDGKVEGAFWNERNWWCMGDSINLETRTEDVVAWMELPAPYNADMRGGKNETL